MSDQSHRREGDEDEKIIQSDDPRLVDAELKLKKVKAQKEKAAMWQSIAMAVLTGVSALGVGLTLWQGRKGPTKATAADFSVKPK
ncbi:MAG TPA: hypothetical protein VFM18_21140 [Methanosarcina sp.]|nr:hypothetical protein [Methanosarcina sp.]